MSEQTSSQLSSSPQQSYFASLMNQVSVPIQEIQKHFDDQHNKIETRIVNGRYEIRETDAPVLKKNNNNHAASSDQDSKLKMMMQAKKDLEGRIHQLEAQYDMYNNSTSKSRQSGDEDQTHRATAASKLSDREHSEFVKEMTRAKKELELRRLERMKEEQKIKNQKEQEKARLEEQQRQERQRKKKEEIEEKLRKINEQKEKRSSEFDLQNRALSSVLQTKPLYQKLQSKYMQLEAASLEEKKKRLAEIRSLHKPISREELDEHERKVMEALREKREKDSRDSNSSSTLPPQNQVYKSSWYKKVIQEEKKQEPKPEEMGLQQAKEKKEKLKQYAEYVRSNFKPEVDENLRRDITTSLHAPKIDVKPEEAKKIGLEYLKYSKEHINLNPIQTKSEQNSTTSQRMISQLPPKPINYLEEQRKNRANSNSESDIIASASRKPMNENERAQYILSQAGKLEEQAKRKEQLARVNNQVLDEQLDDMYMNAIKAKLALLN